MYNRDHNAYLEQSAHFCIPGGFGLLAADIRTLPSGPGFAAGFAPGVAFEPGFGLAPVPVGFVAPPAGRPVGGFGLLAGLIGPLPPGGGFATPLGIDGLGAPPVFGVGAGSALGLPPADGRAFCADGAF